MNEEHLGSSLDDFLMEEGRLAEANAVAAKRVLAFQIRQLMAERQLSKAEMAQRTNTSRAAVDRLLDYETESATLSTLEKGGSCAWSKAVRCAGVAGAGRGSQDCQQTGRRIAAAWSKGSTELARIQELRRAARATIGNAGPFRRNSALEVEVHAPGTDLPRVGDLDNFITGICDGLMRAAGIQKDVRWEGVCWDGIQPCETVGIEDDAHVVSIAARKVADNSNGHWYKVMLSGER